MKIVLAGTPEFALATFEMIIANFEVIAIISQPDRKVGRKQILTPSPVSILAQKHQIPLYCPEQISALLPVLTQLHFDIFLTMAYGQIIPESILNLPQKLALNVHASLLPQYRGAAPVQHALWQGETHTGITLMEMAKTLDSGPILFQAKVAITAEDDAGSLLAKLGALSAKQIVTWLKAIEAGTFSRQPQNEARVSFAPKLRASDEQLVFATMVQTNHQIRALSPNPGAYFWNPKVPGQRIKVFQASSVPVAHAISIPCSDGHLYATSYQIAGKKRITLEIKK